MKSAFEKHLSSCPSTPTASVGQSSQPTSNINFSHQVAAQPDEALRSRSEDWHNINMLP